MASSNSAGRLNSEEQTVLEGIEAARAKQMTHEAVSTGEEQHGSEAQSEAARAVKAAEVVAKPVKVGAHPGRMVALPHEALKAFERSSHHGPESHPQGDDQLVKEGDDQDEEENDTELKRLPKAQHHSWLDDQEEHVESIAELTGAKPEVKRGDELQHVFDNQPEWKIEGKPKKFDFVPKFDKKEKKNDVVQRFVGLAGDDDEDEEDNPYANKAKLNARLHPFVKPGHDDDDVDPSDLVISRTGRVLGVRKPGDILQVSDKQSDIDLAAIGALGEKVLGLDMKDMDGSNGPQRKMDSIYAAGDIDHTYDMLDMRSQVQAALEN